MNSPVALSEVLSWPQALVAIAIIVAVLVVPQVVSIIQSVGLKKQTQAVEHQVTNNGGSSMKDAIDRIERTLTAHVEDTIRREAEIQVRLANLEAAKDDRSN